MEGTIIIGSGHAGTQFALSLRELGYTKPITLISDEDKPPYSRPPLSKAYMGGEITEDDLPLRPEQHYADLDIKLRLSNAALVIDREAQYVTVEDGQRLPYEHLVLATGARNRELPFGERSPSNAHYLRTWDDATQLKEALTTAENVLIVGAGFIGLEFASMAAKCAQTTTVVEMGPRVMGRAVSEEISAYFEQSHRNQGVDVICNTAVDDFLFDDNGDIYAARFGTDIRPADLVLIGIGVLPNIELAEEAGLVCDGGIVVDSNLSTNDPAIFAIGDCAKHPRPERHDLVRVESVQNASDQARFLARHLMQDQTQYSDTPWFWSNQADCRLQIAGLSMPSDETLVLGDPATQKFSVARIRDNTLVALESVNNSADHMACRKLLNNNVRVDVEDLLKPDFSFRALTKRAPARTDPLPVA